MKNLIYALFLALVLLASGCGKKSNPEFKPKQNLTINKII